MIFFPLHPPQNVWQPPARLYGLQPELLLLLRGSSTICKTCAIATRAALRAASRALSLRAP